MEKTYNTLTISKDKQGKDYEACVVNTIHMLLKEGNAISIRQECDDFIIIEYGHDNLTHEYWGTDTLMWLRDDEVEALERYRAEKEENA